MCENVYICIWVYIYIYIYTYVYVNICGFKHTGDYRNISMARPRESAASRNYMITSYVGDHTEPPHPHPRNLLNMVLTSIYTIIHIY